MLLAGIHVITTVNIQHFESLYDEIERATGVKVKERFPDRVLAEADQIVNVDVSVEDLIERLKTGKIYPQERINASLENFFTPTNLTRLRELTLTEIAHLIDRRTRRAEADQAAARRHRPRHGGRLEPQPQRPGPASQDGADRRPAQCPLVCRLRADPAEELTRIDAATQRFLSKNLELAQQLGGIPMTFRGPDVASTMWAFAQEYAIKVIVMGKSRQPWHRRITRNSILDRIMRISHDVDIMIVDVELQPSPAVVAEHQ